ncbi:hypothetical protein KBI33_02900 [Candidatus Shapirobacteria bacterium]|nr:hypothetical protein [Candidatus Shapirobacteria bacterium]
MLKVKKGLEDLGHVALTPIKAKGVDYWAEDNKTRVEATKKFGLIGKHLDKIENSDAILVVNITKKGIANYIGANTFLEMGFAYYRKKRIYILNPLPDQPYIIDELLAFNPIVLNGKLETISSC